MSTNERVSRPVSPAGALCLCLALFAASVGAVATEPGRSALVVVVNDGNDVERMSIREVRKLFLGKSRKLPDGSRAVLVRFEPSSSLFNARVLNRSDAQVDAAWSRLRFSGRVRAPHGFDSVEKLLSFVASTPNAVAYVPVELVTDGVRRVFEVPR